MSGTISMTWIYGIVAVLSFLLALGYCSLVRKKESWLLLLYFSVFVVNGGYFAQALSGTLEEALLANRISYLGSVFLPLFMLMTIMNVCRIKYNKVFLSGMILISILVFLLAASGGYLDLYYKEVSVEFIHGTAKLVKEYGSLHCVYLIYLLAYFGLMVGVIFYSSREKRTTSNKLAIFLATIVLGNVGIWFVEQLIPVDFEFLSVSYVITEVLLLLVYSMLEDGVLVSLEEAAEKETLTAVSRSICEKETLEENDVQESIAVTEEAQESSVINGEEAELPQCQGIELLTARELEVLKYLLQDRKRKDIAEELNVSENTVKKHTSHIFAKLQVANRRELFSKIQEKA